MMGTRTSHRTLAVLAVLVLVVHVVVHLRETLTLTELPPLVPFPVLPPRHGLLRRADLLDISPRRRRRRQRRNVSSRRWQIDPSLKKCNELGLS